MLHSWDVRWMGWPHRGKPPPTGGIFRFRALRGLAGRPLARGPGAQTLPWLLASGRPVSIRHYAANATAAGPPGTTVQSLPLPPSARGYAACVDARNGSAPSHPPGARRVRSPTTALRPAPPHQESPGSHLAPPTGG